MQVIPKFSFRSLDFSTDDERDLHPLAGRSVGTVTTDQSIKQSNQTNPSTSTAFRLACGAAKAGTDNAFGDEQLDVDLAADKIIFDEFRVSHRGTVLNATCQRSTGSAPGAG